MGQKKQRFWNDKTEVEGVEQESGNNSAMQKLTALGTPDKERGRKWKQNERKKRSGLEGVEP